MVLVYCVAVLFGLNGFLKTFFLRKKFYGVWGSALTKKLLRTVFASFFKCRLLSGRFFLVLFLCAYSRQTKRTSKRYAVASLRGSAGALPRRPAQGSALGIRQEPFYKKVLGSPKILKGIGFCVADLLGLNDTFCSRFSRQKVLVKFFQKLAGCRGGALTSPPCALAHILFTISRASSLGWL